MTERKKLEIVERNRSQDEDRYEARIKKLEEAVKALKTVEGYYIGGYPDEDDVRDIYYEVVRPALRKLYSDNV